MAKKQYTNIYSKADSIMLERIAEYKEKRKARFENKPKNPNRFNNKQK